jgi:hypothetical protein
MLEITAIMARPSTSCVLMEFQISEVVNEVLDDGIMGQCTVDDDSGDFDDDYTQSVTPGTHILATATV